MINRIEIENFKSIRALDLPLRSINVLIGANGVGKSNFINFFKLLDSLYNKRLQNYIAEEAGADNVLHFGLQHSDYLSGRLEFDATNTYTFTLKPNQEGGLYFETDKVAFKAAGYTNWAVNNIGSGYTETALKDRQEGGIAQHVNRYMNSFKVFHFHDTSKTAKIKQPQPINDNLFLREDGRNLAPYLYLLQQRYPNVFKKIEMLIRSVAPYFEQFNLHPDRVNEDSIRLEWIQKDSDKYFNAKHLSDGTLRFMALTTLLLQPNAPKVIIIDEPELGLHPFAINKLAGLIKKAAAQSQIIIATQSVNLLDNFTPEDIITVDRQDNQSVFTPQNSENLVDWLQEYSTSDLWNKNVIGGRP